MKPFVMGGSFKDDSVQKCLTSLQEGETSIVKVDHCYGGNEDFLRRYGESFQAHRFNTIGRCLSGSAILLFLFGEERLVFRGSKFSFCDFVVRDVPLRGNVPLHEAEILLREPRLHEMEARDIERLNHEVAFARSIRARNLAYMCLRTKQSRTVLYELLIKNKTLEGGDLLRYGFASRLIDRT